MTGWVPLTKSGTVPPAEFTGMVRAFAHPHFIGLNETLPRVATVLPDVSNCPEPLANSDAVPQSDIESHRAAVQHIREAQSDAEVRALKAEIERLKHAHFDEQKTVNEKTATDMAASLFRQHETAVAGLLETVARYTAEVLRPLLSGAATEAAVRDFTSIVAELLKDGSGAEFSVHIPEANQEHFRKTLPAGIEIVPAQGGDPSIKVHARGVVIASRLAEWSQSITENITGE